MGAMFGGSPAPIAQYPTQPTIVAPKFWTPTVAEPPPEDEEARRRRLGNYQTILRSDWVNQGYGSDGADGGAAGADGGGSSSGGGAAP